MTASRLIASMTLRGRPWTVFSFNQPDDGWWKLTEAGPRVQEGDIIDFFSYLEEGQVVPSGRAMLDIAEKLPGSPTGQFHLEHMLQQVGEIPALLLEERRYVIATATRWQGPGLSECITSISCVPDNRWRCDEPGNLDSVLWRSDGVIATGRAAGSSFQDGSTVLAHCEAPDQWILRGESAGRGVRFYSASAVLT